MLHNWHCDSCGHDNLGHSSVCAYCPTTQESLMKEMAVIMKRHVERQDNGAPQHKHTYQDFKNLLSKYNAVMLNRDSYRKT